MRENTQNLIELRDMETTYSNSRPFSVPEAVFREGEIVSVLGKNGCGKTTVLRVISGLLPYRGSVLIRGKECRDYAPRERAEIIACLPQIVKAVNLNVRMLVSHGRYPHLGNYRRMTKNDRELVDKALAITNMASLAGRNLTQLSGGELRRAYLAMVIAQDAKMIILDEPTAYMDISNQKLYYDIIRELKRRGHGIIQSSHNIEQSFTYSDRIILMADRTVKAQGTPEELLRQTDVLKEVFGASVKKMTDPLLLYPYALVR